MPPLPQYLPLFSPHALVNPEEGKQDRIEINVGTWSADAANRAEADLILSRIGPPPQILRNGRRTTLREDHGNAFGWIFNAANLSSWQQRRKMDVRASPHTIDAAGGEPRVIPPPLFSGSCEWEAEETENCEPVSLSATLKLTLNPTRFIRHHFVAREFAERLHKTDLPAAPHNERAFDESDNWLPLFGRLYVSLTPEGWRERVSRYLRAVENGFDQELSRVCAAHCIPCQRTQEKAYNVKEVETYWEWLSPNPLMIVENLMPFLRTFSRRFRGERTYEAAESSNPAGARIIQIQTAPGEWLKIYAKTNLRIRIEVTHKLAGKRDKFQFPREPDEHGNIRRQTAHTFSSVIGFQGFLRKLQTRAAGKVNEFLEHVGRQSQIVPSQISAYHALFNMTRAIPNDYSTALCLLALLIHERGIPAGGDEAKRRGIDALRAFGIIEPTGRRMYAPTAAYRHAFQTLRTHASFTLLTTRVRRRQTPSTPSQT